MDWERLPERPRRRRWPWLVALAIVIVAGGAVLWRYAPPRAATMADIRTTINSYEAALRPEVPAGAAVGKHLTAAQRVALESGVRGKLREVLTADQLAAKSEVPRLVAQDVADSVASGSTWPLPAGQQIQDVDFVLRDVDGSVVVRVVEWRPTLWGGKDGPSIVEEYELKKLGGRWRIAAARQWGMLPDGSLTTDSGG